MNTIITLGAVVKRINRKLAADDRELRKSRGQRASSDLGDYYLVNTDRNFIVDSFVDPEELGRQLGVLGKSEVVDEDDAQGFGSSREGAK